jgi:hypothetical protein
LGNLIEPTDTLKTLPIKLKIALTIELKSLVTIAVAGLSMLDARPPAMRLNATSKTMTKPSDQMISISSF